MDTMFLQMEEYNGDYILWLGNSGVCDNILGKPVKKLYICPNGEFSGWKGNAKKYYFKWTARRDGKRIYQEVLTYGLTKEPYTERVAP